MTIVWRPSMAVGDEMIDADHQHLVDLINSVESALRGDGDHAALAATLEKLSEYTRGHFAREENLMAIIGYQGVIQHRQAHRKLRARLEELRARLLAAKAAAAASEEINLLVALLRSWLLDHVLKEDMLYKPALHGRP